MLSELDYLARRLAQEQALIAAAQCGPALAAHRTMARAYRTRHDRLATRMAALL